MTDAITKWLDGQRGTKYRRQYNAVLLHSADCPSLNRIWLPTPENASGSTQTCGGSCGTEFHTGVLGYRNLCKRGVHAFCLCCAENGRACRCIVWKR